MDASKVVPLIALAYVCLSGFTMFAGVVVVAVLVCKSK